MTDQEIIDKLNQMLENYNEGWAMYDLQADLEEIFYALATRKDGES